jgi:hypothetical protein
MVMKTYRFQLPDEVGADMEKFCVERNVSISDLIRVSIRQVGRHPLRYELDTKLKFGKYNGETIETIIKIDPEYILWAASTIDGFKLSEKCGQLIEFLLGGDEDVNSNQHPNGDANTDTFSFIHPGDFLQGTMTDYHHDSMTETSSDIPDMEQGTSPFADIPFSSPTTTTTNTTKAGTRRHASPKVKQNKGRRGKGSTSKL